MAKPTKIVLPQSPLVPAEAHAAVARLNKIAAADVEITTPAQAGGKGGYQEAGENTRLVLGLQFESAIADLAGGATLAQVITKINAILAQLRKTKQNPT